MSAPPPGSGWPIRTDIRLKSLTRALVDVARGGVGLIISGHAYVSPEGRAGRRQLGIYSDDYIGPLREITKAVHDAGGKIVAQISHAGCEAVAQPAGRTASRTFGGREKRTAALRSQ